MPRTTPSAADIDKALERLQVFEGRLGYPRNGAGLQAAAKAFARIVHFKPPSEIVSRPGDRLAGVTDDSEWLVEEVYELSEKFPSMATFRAVYRQFLPPRELREDLDIDVR